GAPYEQCEPTANDTDGDCIAVPDDCDDSDPTVGAYTCQEGDDTCAQTCANRSSNACEPDPTQSCIDACLGLTAVYPTAIDTALLACFADDLCTSGLDSCILERLYPEPINLPVTIAGDGFDEVADDTQVFLVAGESATGQTTVQKGNFSVTVDTTGPAHVAPRVSWYIDVDGNTTCDENDIAGSNTATFTGGFDAPTYSLLLSGPADATGECLKP
ncbi:MAG: hypothetical protein AAFX99_35915, partial [Myxococcota bacterium]